MSDKGKLRIGESRYRRLGKSVLWQTWGYNDEHWFTIGRDESDVLSALERTQDRLANAEEILRELAAIRCQQDRGHCVTHSERVPCIADLARAYFEEVVA